MTAKNAFFCLILALILVVFTACAGLDVEGGDPFSAFQGDFGFGVSVNYAFLDARASIVRAGEAFKITFTYPDELSGYEMTAEGEDVFLSFGEIRTEVSKERAGLFHLLRSVFSEKAENVVSVTVEDGRTNVGVSCGNVYVFDKNNAPLSVSGSFSGKNFLLSFDKAGGEA